MYNNTIITSGKNMNDPQLTTIGTNRERRVK